MEGMESHSGYALTHVLVNIVYQQRSGRATLPEGVDRPYLGHDNFLGLKIDDNNSLVIIMM